MQGHLCATFSNSPSKKGSLTFEIRGTVGPPDPLGFANKNIPRALELVGGACS